MRTVDLARASLSHPNTVRLYEEWGFLAPAERGANGYRLWTGEHLDQMVFARAALDGFWPGRAIRHSALALVRLAASGGASAALPAAAAHAELVRGERRRAEAAAAYLQEWASRAPAAADAVPAREAAPLVGATAEQLRNWERNGLIDAPREERTGRRLYGSAELGRARVIRTLLLAGYSMMAIRRMTAELDRGRTGSLAAVLDTPREDEDVLTAFDRWRSFLSAQERRAELLIDLLRARLSNTSS